MENLTNTESPTNLSPVNNNIVPIANINNKSPILIILLGLVLLAIVGFGGYYLGSHNTSTTSIPANNLEQAPITTTPENITPTKPDVAVTPSVNSYKYKTFSFNYPSDWQMFDDTTNKKFFDDATLKFDRSIMLQKSGYYLFIGIDDVASGDVSGIFENEQQRKDFMSYYDDIEIMGSKYLLNKGATAFSWLTDKQSDGGGIWGTISVAEYIPKGVKTETGIIYDSYNMYLKKNGVGYTLVKFAPTEETNTPANVQSEFKTILESINW